MKGQALNIDWTIGMSLFIVTLLSGTFFLVNQDLGFGNINEKTEKASLVAQGLEKEAYIDGRQAPLYVRGPLSVGTVPVDAEYLFLSDGYPGSGAMDIPASIDISAASVVTVTDTGNTTHNMTYFFTNVSNVSYSNQIQTGNWINNSEISVKPGSPGLLSLQVNGNELLNETAEFPENSYSITEKELHASTLSGELKLYNNTPELIYEPGNATFNLRNLTTLYWYADNSTTTLAGTGTFKNGETAGLTVASGYGITFLGPKLEAKVSKPDPETVTVEVNSSRLRVRLHDSDYVEGRKRIHFFRKGNIFFGAEKKLSGATEKRISSLNSMPQSRFENILELEGWGYNITLRSMERGTPIPFEEVVVRNGLGAMVGRTGNYSSIDERVAIWR